MTKRRVVCASIGLLLGLAACSSGASGTGEPTSVVPQASPAASGVVNPAASGYPGPSQAPAAVPAGSPSASYPAPSASP